MLPPVDDVLSGSRSRGLLLWPGSPRRGSQGSERRAAVMSGVLPVISLRRAAPRSTAARATSAGPRSSSQSLARRILRSAASRKPTVSRWLVTASAAMRAGATFAVSWERAVAAHSHHCADSCSKAAGADLDPGTGARPSAYARPSRVQATALVAVVLLASPTTRSIERIHATANLTNGDHICIGDSPRRLAGPTSPLPERCPPNRSARSKPRRRSSCAPTRPLG